MGMISYTMETLPQLSKEELDRVAMLEDEAIDCSDIPEINDTSALRPKINKEAQVTFTCKLDADVAAWLTQRGRCYQAHINSILRQIMAHAQ